MDWLSALRTLWEDFAKKPVWGVNDCCQYAARYVQLRTGDDHAAKFEYHDKSAALRILSEYDGLTGVISMCIGPPLERHAIAGDLVICDMGESGFTTGVFNGDLVLGIHPEHGLVQILASRINCAWDPCHK